MDAAWRARGRHCEAHDLLVCRAHEPPQLLLARVQDGLHRNGARVDQDAFALRSQQRWAVADAAGRFAARHYALRWDPAWPPADLWVRREDCIFLAMRWAQVPTRYELTELTEEPAA